MLSRLSRASLRGGGGGCSHTFCRRLVGAGDDLLIATQQERLIALGEMNRLIQVAVVIADCTDLTEVGGDVYAFGS